jgi:hypothetical protein
MTTPPMTLQTQPLFAVEEMFGTTPFIVEFFMVQGTGFRCMAYCDEKGGWHDAFNHEQLFGDIQILE